MFVHITDLLLSLLSGVSLDSYASAPKQNGATNVENKHTKTPGAWYVVSHRPSSVAHWTESRIDNMCERSKTASIYVKVQGRNKIIGPSTPRLPTTRVLGGVWVRPVAPR